MKQAQRQEDDIILIPLVKTIVTVSKTILHGISLLIIWLFDLRNGAIENVDFVKKANNTSVSNLVSTNKTTKRYSKLKKKFGD